MHNNLGSGVEDIGLVYMAARWYAPTLGRFISADTLIPNPTNPQSYNRYSYVGTRVLNATDPTGHRECVVDLEPDDCSDGGPYAPLLADPVDFTGFDDADTYQAEVMTAIRQAALLVGQALADVLNQMHPNWYLTAVEAFLLVYGGTFNFIWQGASPGNYAAQTQNATEIWIYDTKDTVGRVTHKVEWIVHELGHAFSHAVGGTTNDTQAFFDANPGVGRDGFGNDTGYAGDKVDGSRYWQQSYDTAAAEQFADMFIGWVYGQWELDDYGNMTSQGIAMSNFMNGNMPTWLNLKGQQ